MYRADLDGLSDNDRKKYIYDNVLRYSSIRMYGPDATNSAMDIEIAARNMSTRSIKYIYYTVKFKNNVGDEIDNSLFGDILTFTGPVEPGEIGGEDSYWPSVIFDSKRRIKEWLITKVEIEYDDGNTIVLRGEDVQNDDKVEAGGYTDHQADEDISVAVDDLFNMSFDEITSLYGHEFESFEYAGCSIIDYHEAGHNISLGFSLDSFSPSNKPLVIYTRDAAKLMASYGITNELTPLLLSDALGDPLSRGYDEMGEEGYVVEYCLNGISYRFIFDDEFSTIGYIEMTKISFMGIEDYLSKTYGELIEQFGDDCKVEKRDNGVVTISLLNTEEDIQIWFLNPSNNPDINPKSILFSPSVSKLYNGISHGMMEEEIEGMLGLPVSKKYSENIGDLMVYDYDKFSVELCCDESFGLYMISISNQP